MKILMNVWPGRNYNLALASLTIEDAKALLLRRAAFKKAAEGCGKPPLATLAFRGDATCEFIMLDDDAIDGIVDAETMEKHTGITAEQAEAFEDDGYVVLHDSYELPDALPGGGPDDIYLYVHEDAFEWGALDFAYDNTHDSEEKTALVPFDVFKEVL